ncbi:MAG: hypothetical protein HeimC2_13450 [Candidatus Heimdallarchaeota archaeon LC_2]|nr:MAG: hypothetical protein HeimC2_13450 [Candidatus Heimdallarchaeota archaeon LC_2]
MNIGSALILKRKKIIIFYVILFQILIASTTVSSHIENDKEERSLSFYPEIKYFQQNQNHLHLSHKTENHKLTIVQEIFMFDSLVINFQIYDTPTLEPNETKILSDSLRIELITTFLVLIDGSYQEYNRTRHSVPHGNQEQVDFTTVIDPTHYFNELWSFYDNSLSLENSRESSDNNINVEFKLQFTYSGFSRPDIDLTIDYVVQTLRPASVDHNEFHNDILGSVSAFPYAMLLDKQGILNSKSLFLIVPYELTSRFFERMLWDHNLTLDDSPKIEMILNMGFSYDEDIIDSEQPDVILFQQGERFKRTKKEDSTIEFRLQYEPGFEQVLEIDVTNYGGLVEVWFEAFFKIPAIFYEREYSQGELIWQFIVLNKWWFILGGAITILAGRYELHDSYDQPMREEFDRIKYKSSGLSRYVGGSNGKGKWVDPTDFFSKKSNVLGESQPEEPEYKIDKDLERAINEAIDRLKTDPIFPTSRLIREPQGSLEQKNEQIGNESVGTEMARDAEKVREGSNLRQTGEFNEASRKENQSLNRSWVPEPHVYEVQGEGYESEVEKGMSEMEFRNAQDSAAKDFHSLPVSGSKIEVIDDFGADLNDQSLGEEKSSGAFSESFAEIQSDFDLRDDQPIESVGTEIVPSVVDVSTEDSGSLDFYEIQGAREIEEPEYYDEPAETHREVLDFEEKDHNQDASGLAISPSKSVLQTGYSWKSLQSVISGGLGLFGSLFRKISEKFAVRKYLSHGNSEESSELAKLMHPRRISDMEFEKESAPYEPYEVKFNSLGSVVVEPDVIEEAWDFVFSGMSLSWVAGKTGLDRNYLFHLFVNMMYLNELMNSVERRRGHIRDMREFAKQAAIARLKKAFVGSLGSLGSEEGERIEITLVVRKDEVDAGSEFEVLPVGKDGVEYVVIRDEVSPEFLQNVLLGKLAFYASYNELGSEMWEEGILVSGNSVAGADDLSVRKLLGEELVKDEGVHAFLGGLLNRGAYPSGLRGTVLKVGKQISEVKPGVQYLLDSKPTVLIGDLSLKKIRNPVFGRIWGRIEERTKNTKLWKKRDIRELAQSAKLSVRKRANSKKMDEGKAEIKTGSKENSNPENERGYSKAVLNQPISIHDLVDLKVSVEELLRFVEDRASAKIESGQNPRYEMILAELLRHEIKRPGELVERLRMFEGLTAFYLLVRLDYYKDLEIVKHMFSEFELVGVEVVYGLRFDAEGEVYLGFRFDNFVTWFGFEGGEVKASVRKRLAEFVDLGRMEVLEGQEEGLQGLYVELRREWLVAYLGALGDAMRDVLDPVVDRDVIEELWGDSEKVNGIFSDILDYFDINAGDMKKFVLNLSDSIILSRLGELEHSIYSIRNHHKFVEMFMKVKGATPTEIKKYLIDFQQNSLILRRDPNGFDHLVFYTLPVNTDKGWEPSSNIIMVPAEIKSNKDGSNMSTRFLINTKFKHGKDYIHGPLDIWSKHKRTPEELRKIFAKNSLKFHFVESSINQFDSLAEKSNNTIALYGRKAQDILNILSETEQYSTLRIVYLDIQNNFQFHMLKPSILQHIIESDDELPLEEIDSKLIKLQIPIRNKKGKVMSRRYINSVGEFKEQFKNHYGIYPTKFYQINSTDEGSEWISKIDEYWNQFPISKDLLEISVTDIEGFNLSHREGFDGTIVLLDPITIEFQDDEREFHKLKIRIWDLQLGDIFTMKANSLICNEITESCKQVEKYLKKFISEEVLVIPSINKNNQAVDFIVHRLENNSKSMKSKNNSWTLKYVHKGKVQNILINSQKEITKHTASKKLVSMFSNTSYSPNQYYYGASRFGSDKIENSAIHNRLAISDSFFKPIAVRHRFFDFDAQNIDQIADGNFIIDDIGEFYKILPEGVYIDLNKIREHLYSLRNSGEHPFFDESILTDEVIDKLVSMFDLAYDGTGSDAQEHWLKYIINYYNPNRYDSVKFVEGLGYVIRLRAWINIPKDQLDPSRQLRTWIVYNPGRGPNSKSPTVRSLLHKNKDKKRKINKGDVLKSHQGLPPLIHPPLLDELTKLLHSPKWEIVLNWENVNFRAFNNIADKLTVIFDRIINDLFSESNDISEISGNKEELD